MATKSPKSAPVQLDPSYSAAESPDGVALVLMEKDFEEIDVHPATVDQHRKLGWRVKPVPTQE